MPEEQRECNARRKEENSLGQQRRRQNPAALAQHARVKQRHPEQDASIGCMDAATILEPPAQRRNMRLPAVSLILTDCGRRRHLHLGDRAAGDPGLREQAVGVEAGAARSERGRL
ncbi:hypothetical protein V5799_005516 [Amblyomma americanum]|uniref:Uncharacterized protein n=1 Tax=Amblyomma americanum TaxID=6943 RepID=A0AAQ4DZ17_AMBAM